MRSIAHVSVVVADYDEAIAFYRDALGFAVIENTPLSGGKRWVLVGPEGDGAALLLARAANNEQRAHIGNQTGGRVFLFLHTDDFKRDHARLTAHGARFIEGPRQEAYGTVGVFLDLYGNKWELIERR